MSSDRIELWGGWSLALPSPCQMRRDRDGSWSAWDATHVVEVSIIETAGTPSGPINPERMLAKATESWARHDVDGLAVRVSTDVEMAETQAGTERVEWSRVQAGAINTVMIVNIGTRGARDSDWHQSLWQSLRHESPKRGLLGRLRGR